MKKSSQLHFLESLADPFGGDEVFDDVLDTVYFVKDEDGRYVFVNETLVKRCGGGGKDDLLGKTAGEVFPGPLGKDFESQDRAILAGGAAIRSQLELHIYPDGRQGWCLTWKRPLKGGEGRVVGLAGISRDVDGIASSPKDLESLAEVMEYVKRHLDQPLRLGDLAEATGLSTYQINQRMETLLGLSPKQYISRCRIDAACHLLGNSSDPLTEIALTCGYSDQSSFTRQFGRIVGMTPSVYRNQRRAV
ncbi:MAG: AraC family transcriptional regulator [Akkermansiaceae bacterium]|nr:AraC family transcriptional regulator [Akkermansiaceae bacterium]